MSDFSQINNLRKTETLECDKTVLLNFRKMIFEESKENKINLKYMKSTDDSSSSSITCNSQINLLEIDENFDKTDYNDEENEFKKVVEEKSIRKKRTYKILIIDDELMIRCSLTRHLGKIAQQNSDLNFEISDATNCFEALNIIYDNFMKNIHFDLILIDEYMPYMKGSTLIKLLKQLNNENNFYKMVIISHTAFDTDDKKKFVMDNGADYIISKPTDIEKLKIIILDILI